MKSVFKLEINPEEDKNYAIEAIGLLPYWVRDYAASSIDIGIVEYMERAYGFGKLYEYKGKVEGDKYVSPHEDDEPLDYIAKSGIEEGTVYYFPYGIIALPIVGGHFITRMD